MKNKRVLLVSADSFACGFFRIKQPYENLKCDDIEFEILNIKESNTLPLQLLFGYNAIVFQRPILSSIPSLIDALKKQGVKIVIETDDLLTNISPTSSCYNAYRSGGSNLKNFLYCIKNANYVHTSTPELAVEMRRYNKNVASFNNALKIDDEIYKEKLPRLSDKPVVMWAGSSTHFDSLLVIKSAVEEAIKKTDAIFAFCSNKSFFDMFDLPDGKKIFVEPVSLEEYPKIPSYADIFLTPVIETPFNNSKSELKILESGIYGIPSISSPVAPYIRFNKVSDGANILVKKNKTKNWTKEIINLIENEELRKELGKRTKDTIEQIYDLDVINGKRLEWWRNFLA